MKHNVFPYILAALGLCTGVWMFVSCSKTASGDMPQEPDGLKTWLSVDVTRSGNGTEESTDAESAITDVTLFFIEGRSIDDPEAKLVTTVYFGEDTKQEDGTTFGSVPVSMATLPIGSSYLVLACTNTGTQSWDMAAVKSFTTTPFQPGTTPQEASRFVMASAEPESVTMEVTGRYAPQTIEVEVGRLAARADVSYKASYTVGKQDRVTIEGVALVNNLRSSYLFARSTEGALLPDSEDVLRDDTGPEAGAADFAGSFGIYYGDKSYNADPSKIPFAEPSASVRSGDEDEYGLAGYTCENYFRFADPDEAHPETGITGVVFKARYVPHGFTPGATFYRYGGRLYSDRAAVVAAIEAAGGSAPGEGDDLKRYGVTTYTDGICYYTYWLHDTATEYAVARNGLYQLDVTSIGGIGSEEPFPGEPVTIHVTLTAWVVADNTENIDIDE